MGCGAGGVGGVAGPLGELDEAGWTREVVGVNAGGEVGEAVEEGVGGSVEVFVGDAEDRGRPERRGGGASYAG